MKPTGSLIASIALASLALGAGSQGRPDFSGRWVAEPEAVAGPTAAGAPGGPLRGSMGSGWGSPITITQTPEQLIVEQPIFSRYDLQPPLRHVYALDGSETRYPIMISHATQMRISRAAWKDGALEIRTIYPVTEPDTRKPFTVELTQRLFLESPTTLTVETTRGGAFGGRSIISRTVYQKQ
jgi:hypothetical protein